MAKNYMADVAEILGVKMGEKFKLAINGEIETKEEVCTCKNEPKLYERPVLYWFSEKGLEDDGDYNLYEEIDEYNPITIWKILRGDIIIVPCKEKEL